MLDKLRQWTLRMLYWSIPDGPDAACRTTLGGQQETRDPRELPRPHRILETEAAPIKSGGESGNTSEEDAGTGSWCCRNCAYLSAQLLECAICLEPLSARARRGVTSCMECGNVACLSCAERLPRCPYCRSEPGLVLNLALQRLVYKLHIPHTISIGTVRCPHKTCDWRGDFDYLARHLEQAHLVTILNGSRVTLDIADFHRKAEQCENRARHYSVLLACFSDVFVCKVLLYQGKLKVILSQLTKAKHTRIAAWVEISCLSRVTKGIIPLSKNKSEFEVPVANFVFPTEGSSDRVEIAISIRPLW